eukprot:1420750-Pleurochrysis_carterae.AAC.1
MAMQLEAFEGSSLFRITGSGSSRGRALDVFGAVLEHVSDAVPQVPHTLRDGKQHISGARYALRSTATNGCQCAGSRLLSFKKQDAARQAVQSPCLTVHVVDNVGKGDLGLNHPELSQ